MTKTPVFDCVMEESVQRMFSRLPRKMSAQSLLQMATLLVPRIDELSDKGETWVACRAWVRMHCYRALAGAYGSQHPEAIESLDWVRHHLATRLVTRWLLLETDAPDQGVWLDVVNEALDTAIGHLHPEIIDGLITELDAIGRLHPHKVDLLEPASGPLAADEVRSRHRQMYALVA